MKTWPLRTALAMCAGCILPASLAAVPQDSAATKLASDGQLRDVLLQAKDAVVAETRLPENGYDSMIEADVKRVTRYLLKTGNRSDVLYLQQHLESEYAEKIRGALQPAETLADFAARAQAVDQESNDYLHDEDIELIVEQEIERGFLEDALEKTKLMRVRFLQTRLMGSVGLSAFKQGSPKIAERAAAAAVDRAKSDESAPDLYLDHQGMLLELARMWFEGGYSNAALIARKAAMSLLEVDTRAHEYQGHWRDLGDVAAQQGDLEMAGQMLDHISEPEQRISVEAEMQRAQTTMTTPNLAVQIAIGMHEGYLKFGALRGIAIHQVEAGDKTGAARTLQIAKEVANGDDDSRVMRMADIAWEQISMGDKSAAESTIAEGLKDNEKHRWGSDQVNGWMMLAEALASMGEYDRALQVARKIEYAPIRARTLELVAYHETEAGHQDWAISWAQEIEDPEGRARTFLGIADALVEQVPGEGQDINE